MNRSSSARLRGLAWIAGGAVVASATVLWLVRRSGENQKTPEVASAPSVGENFEESPSSYSFEPAAPPTEGVTARPSERPTGISSPDDYDSLSPDDLGAAFLAGATDTSLDEPPSSTAELSGFQIYERDAVPDGKLNDEDEDLAQIFDRPSRARRR